MLKIQLNYIQIQISNCCKWNGVLVPAQCSVVLMNIFRVLHDSAQGVNSVFLRVVELSLSGVCLLLIDKYFCVLSVLPPISEL